MQLAYALGLLSILCWSGVALLMWRYRPPRPLWPIAFWFVVAGLLWAVGELGATYHASGPVEHWRWLLFLYSGVLFATPLWWSLTLRFSEMCRQRPAWANRAVEWAPFVVAVLCWLALITNPWHGRFITAVWDGRNHYGPLWYVQAANSYVALALSVLLTLWMKFQNSSKWARSQFDVLAVAALIPFVCNVLYVTRVWEPGIDPTVVGFNLGVAVLFAGVTRKRLFAISGLTLEHLIQHETDGVVIVGHDGHTVSANAAAARLLGVPVLSPADSFVDLLATRLDATSSTAMFSRLYGLAESPHGHSFGCANGPCKWMRIQVTRLPGGILSRGGLGVRLRDESRLHESTERAARQAASIEAILSSMQDGLLVVEASGCPSYANDKFWEMWGLDKVEMLEDVSEKELWSGIVERLAGGDEMADRVEGASDLAALFEDKDLVLKSGRVVSVGMSPFLQEETSVGRIWTFRDVTDKLSAEEERRRIEERMRESQKIESLGILAGGIAHDFNNILVGVLGNVELAMAKLEKDAPAQAQLTGARRSAERAAELVQQLLAYAGRGRVMSVELDLSSLVNETRELVRTAISKKAELRVELDESLYVDGDPVQIRQIVMNLITNASDALEEQEGLIRIRTGRRRLVEGDFRDALPRPPDAGEYAFLEIEDSGIGMDRATRRKIFEPFFSTKFAGRGLGLSAVLGIIRSHRGYVRVRSQMGEGTVFTVLLPRVDAPERGEPVLLHRETPSVPAQCTVLVVDDEETVRTVALHVLEDEGFEVLVAGDGHEALSVVREAPKTIDAIVLDMTMPRMDGVEALFAIREVVRDLPVILSSGYREQDTMARCADLSGVSFIQKPYTPSLLAAKVREAVHDRQSGVSA